jgi:hypothetical protein
VGHETEAPPMTPGNMRAIGRIGSGRTPDWIKVKNPDAPGATRVIEG